MRQELQDPAMRSLAVGLLRQLPGGTALGRTRLGVHPKVQQNAKDGHIPRLRGHMDGIDALEANLS